MKIKVDNFRRMDSGSTAGFADVTFDGVITVSDVRLIDGRNGLFAAMPSRKGNDGKYHEIVKITDTDIKDELTRALINSAGLEGPDEGWDS